jgi:hypothetical protein
VGLGPNGLAAALTPARAGDGAGNHPQDFRVDRAHRSAVIIRPLWLGVGAMQKTHAINE